MAQGHPLDDAEREYRRVLGARIEQATVQAGLNKTRLAELTGERGSNIGQIMKGSVEDLLADEGAPMTVQGPEGRCPAGYVIEASAPRFRVSVLLICDRRVHGDGEAHHDPRGLAWRSASGI
jgi:hypothetical protein